MTFKEISGAVCAPAGFKVATIYAGIRRAERDDLMLIVSDRPAAVAGVQTTNLVHAWCVAHNRERLTQGNAQAIVCNAGNANCCNGEAGKAADLAMQLGVQAFLGLKGSASVLTASTGVIGREFPIGKVEQVLPKLCAKLTRSDEAGEQAAAAIMTTDLVPKSVAVEVRVGDKVARIGGISKGSGMIAPNMATMLGFITTDVAIPAAELQRVVTRCVNKSFNCITVDSDTSTNDMVLMLANGASGVQASELGSTFEEALLFVCTTLAKKIARDGEGATKLITLTLKNPPKDGFKIAKTIAESPLVKTACFGNDPNWGRIVAAAGRAGVDFDPKKVTITLAGYEVFRHGEPTAFDPAQVSAAMKSSDLSIELHFESAETSEPITVWTCDFSYDYVRINADYGT